MAAAEPGSVEWLKGQRRLCIQYVRALDNFRVAQEFGAALIDGWETLSITIKSALHHAMVIEYCRPYIESKDKDGRRLPELKTRWMRSTGDCDLELHRHLLNIRHTLIAHSDEGVLAGQSSFGVLEFQTGEGEIAIPAQLRVQVASLSEIVDKTLLQRLFAHFDGCFAAIAKMLDGEMRRYLELAVTHPEEFAEHTQGKSILAGGGQFESGGILPTEEMQKIATQNMVYPQFPVTIEGYQYRLMAANFVLTGKIRATKNSVPFELEITQEVDSKMIDDSTGAPEDQD